MVLAAELDPPQPTFVLDRGAERWLPILEQHGMRTAWLDDVPNRDWAGTVLDAYECKQADLEAWSREAPPLVYMDDFLNPPSMVALAVNPAPHLSGNTLGAIPALLGPQFALVARVYRRAVEIRAEVRRVVVTFGARDSKNATALALDALHAAAPDLAPAIDVVVSATAVHLGDIQSKVAQLPSATLHTDLSDLAGVYSAADLVIGGGGVSLLERMAMGLPSLTVTLSENQALAVAGAARAGGTVAVGNAEDLTLGGLAAQIVKLAHDHAARLCMSAAARTLIDGRGAERVAREMMRLSMSYSRSGRA